MSTFNPEIPYAPQYAWQKQEEKPKEIEEKPLTRPLEENDFTPKLFKDVQDAVKNAKAEGFKELAYDVICSCPTCRQTAKIRQAWYDFPSIPDRIAAKEIVKEVVIFK